MKYFGFRGVFGALLVFGSTNTVSADESADAITVNLSLSTDYLFRFVSQTREQPALSGGLDWSADNGFYLGVWGSNVDLGDDAHLEMDFYGGYTYEFESGWMVDVGVIDYEYFDDQANDNILEVFGSVARGPASFSVYYEVEHGDYYWFEGSVEHKFGPVNLVASVGRLEPGQGSGYSGWSLQAAFPINAFDISVTWADTNGNGERAFGAVADSRVILSLATVF